MDVKLAKEIAYFMSEAKRLRRLLRETQRCFNDINMGDSLLRAELQPEEEFIQSTTRKSPCIVIFGSSNPAKATIVNELFAKPVLPVMWNEACDVPWRTVHFKPGSTASISLSIQGSYEVVDNVVGQHSNWDTVPTQDLQIDDKDKHGKQTDLANTCAILDIKLQNVLLSEGCDVVVAQSLDGKESLEDVYRKCSADVLPIFIYAVDKPVFAQEEVNQLKQLKVIDPDITIFFVRVTKPNSVETYPVPKSPMAKIRDTLSKSHIASSCSKDDRQSCALNTAPKQGTRKARTPECTRKRSEHLDTKRRRSIESLSTSIKISSYLPCAAHNKASCPECKMQDSVHVKNTPQSGALVENVAFQRSSDSEIEDILSDVEGDEEFISSMETQVSAGRPTAPRPSSGNDQARNVHFELNPQKPSAKSKNDSTISNAGDDIHREFALSLFQQLLDCNYLSMLPPSRHVSVNSANSMYEACDSELAEKFANFTNVLPYVHIQLQKVLTNTVSLLNIVHTRCLQSFILTAFDMARDMQVTPKKLEYARDKERQLYQCLMEISDKKQDEIRDIIAETVASLRDPLLDKAEEYDFIGVDIPESGDIQSARDLKICTGQIQALVLENLNSAIATKLLNSMDILKDSYTGVLARCLESLEKSDSASPESVRTTLALREILNSAYQVEITVSAGSSLLRMLYEKMKQLMRAMSWRNLAHIDNEWKKKVATEMLETLSEHRLAKSICSQIKDRLKQSHESFESALKQLQSHHSGRLERTEEQRLKVRKVHAPRVARLALESISMKDYIVYGMPHLGPEIGRGQYGVVYSCDKWAGREPVAIKSVVPPDDKHWNDLALEFYYTKNVPEHDRIAVLRGSVIDYSYGGGSSPAVLLIMDRLQRDLYAAIKTNLDWLSRLQVAIDVVEGIRFLHSQGLVHRDIKLKNVLLDKKNRALITDLGFCKPEAMMSGSIVGTPIHMAPELFSGRYDNSVDVYAFGILFWYVCAGHVRLPYAFEQCTNKEMLWTSVKRGVRPEKLGCFDPECWGLMQICWAGEIDERPHLGLVQPKLQNILERFRKDPTLRHSSHSRRKSKTRSGHSRERRDRRS